MKKITAALLLLSLSTHLIVCSELYDDAEYIISKITWENGKKIVKDNQDKILGILGVLGCLIMTRHFYLQSRILQEIGDLRNEMYNGKMNGQDIDRLHEILMQDDVDGIIKDMQKFLGHTETIKVGKVLNTEAITFDNILGKVHICWHSPEDYGKQELNKFEELLWRYNKKYKKYNYPNEIEVHYKNRRIECILVPLKR